MSVRVAVLSVDTFRHGRTNYIGEFLRLGEEFLLLKYTESRTPRAATTIRRFIKQAGELANELQVDFFIDPTVSTLLNIKLIGTSSYSTKGRKYAKGKANASIRCI
jgi:hypothetical protein